MAVQKIIRALTVPSLMALSIAAAQAVEAPVHNVSPAIHTATDLGRLEPSKVINLTIRLKLPNQALFDRTLEALYTPGSASFHHWLSDSDLQKFAPTHEQLDTVTKELERNGLKVLSFDKNGFSVRVSGTIASVEKAFNTEIHQFEVNGKFFRSHITDAHLSGTADAYVSAVAGLESHTIHPTLKRAVDPKTQKPLAKAISVAEVEAKGGLSAFITTTILSPPEKWKLGAGTTVSGTFVGDVYGINTPKLFPDYGPKELQAAYHLQPAYAAGIDGTGQTVALLEAYGYPTAEADANAMAKLSGLPQLSIKNFRTVYPEGKPFDPNAGIEEGWDGEIALDIQSAHAIAPGAKILVVATSGQDSEDFQYSMQYIVDHHLADTVSDSWEEDTDLVSGPYEEESFEQVLAIAAAKGVSFQFSTGDSGDGGVGSPIGAPGVPSDAPHATAIGGTAILNQPGGNYRSVGWGDVFQTLDIPGVAVTDPSSYSSYDYFYAGGGGGESVYFAKPTWQAALPGTGRQTPDVSALADPYTGFPIVVSSTNCSKTGKVEKCLEPGVGGTSLASPIFTAFWALAVQQAGHALGQAAPTIAGLGPNRGVIDVLPTSSSGDVKATLKTSSGTTHFTAPEIFPGLVPAGEGFTSALFNDPYDGQIEGLAFGLDSSLTVTKGWDNATGYGTPNGYTFIKAAAAYK